MKLSVTMPEALKLSDEQIEKSPSHLPDRPARSTSGPDDERLRPHWLGSLLKGRVSASTRNPKGFTVFRR